MPTLGAILSSGSLPFRAGLSRVSTSMDKHMIFVAEDDQAQRLGFVTVTHQTHFTGERQAYIGELATTESAERRGSWQSAGRGL